jgi:tetratricopeptide (TPR) repeat protein
MSAERRNGGTTRASSVAPGRSASFGRPEAGERSYLSTAAGYLGQALCALGRFDAADDPAERALALGASDDALTQTLSRQVRAKVRGHRGGIGEAEQLARGAVDISGGTDLLNVQAHAWSDLAGVLLQAGRAEEASRALDEALTRFARKGNVVMAERTRQELVHVRTLRRR